MTEPVVPSLGHLLRVELQVGAPVSLGQGNTFEKKYIPILGGVFSGEKLQGKVLPGGGDWQTIDPSGVAQLDARFMLETADGAHIEVQDCGLRIASKGVLSRLKAGEPVMPQEYYFRTATRFDTGDERYRWLSQLLAVGSGCKTAEGVVLDFYQLL